MNMTTAIALPPEAAERPGLVPPRARFADTPAIPAAASSGALGEAEKAALLASFADGRASLAAAGLGRRVGRAIFGLRPPVRLAAARLEALRRYALLYRLEGAALPLDEDMRLREAGFSDRQAEAARALVDAQSPHRRERPGKGGAMIPAALLAAGAALAFLIDRWLAHQVDDPLAAHVVTILLVTSLVSIIAVTGHPHPRRA